MSNPDPFVESTPDTISNFIVKTTRGGFKVYTESKRLARNKKANVKQKEKRLADKDGFNARRRLLWRNGEWQKRRQEKYMNKPCMFCGVSLGSKLAGVTEVFSGKKVTKYCIPCREDPEIKKYLATTSTRRMKQKRQGLPLEPVSLEGFMAYKRMGKRYVPLTVMMGIPDPTKDIGDVTPELREEAARIDKEILEARKAAIKKQDSLVRQQNKRQLRDLWNEDVPVLDHDQGLQNDPF